MQLQQPVGDTDIPFSEQGRPVTDDVGVAGEVIAGAVIVGPTVGATVIGLGNGVVVIKLGSGTDTDGLTPALPISKEPSGIPGRETPPGTTGVIGFEDEAIALEPLPHVPVIPVVAMLPGTDVPVEVPIDVVVSVPIEVPSDTPGDNPPPSKIEVEPAAPDDGAPMTEQSVLLPIIPVMLLCGLRPGDASSVAPKGIPVGATVVFGVMPSGDVAPMLGVVTTICANAAWQEKSADNIAAASNRRAVCFIATA